MRSLHWSGRGLLLTFFLLSSTAGAATVVADDGILRAQGRAVAFDDGDSFDLLIPRRGRVSIRLHAVDAPETVQPYGKRARQGLIDAVAGQPVRVACYKRDARGRYVCRAWAGDRDLQLHMLQLGLAWHLTMYLDEQSSAERNLYRNAQRQARGARRGLWAQTKPMAPWECRRHLYRLQACR